MTCMQRAICVSGKTFVLLALLMLSTELHALEPFPLSQVVLEVRTHLATATVQSTGLGRSNYLNVISGVVNYFKHFQDKEGRIIDPFYQKEFQYSTPCYA